MDLLVEYLLGTWQGLTTAIIRGRQPKGSATKIRGHPSESVKSSARQWSLFDSQKGRRGLSLRLQNWRPSSTAGTKFQRFSPVENRKADDGKSPSATDWWILKTQPRLRFRRHADLGKGTCQGGQHRQWQAWISLSIDEVMPSIFSFRPHWRLREAGSCSTGLSWRFCLPRLKHCAEAPRLSSRLVRVQLFAKLATSVPASSLGLMSTISVLLEAAFVDRPVRPSRQFQGRRLDEGFVLIHALRRSFQACELHPPPKGCFSPKRREVCCSPSHVEEDPTRFSQWRENPDRLKSPPPWCLKEGSLIGK